MRYLLPLLCFCLLACQQEVPTYKRVVEDMAWKAIRVGGYVMDFPADFKLVEEQGIDSYVGRVEGDSISFFFDYGHYSSDLGASPEEYLQDSSWIIDAGLQFMKPGKGYVHSTLPRPLILSIRSALVEDSSFCSGCDYIAHCQYNTTIFNYPIYLPEATKSCEYKVDTIDYQYRKIVLAKPPHTSATTGMYIRDISEKDLALSIVTDSLTKEQQELVLKIFSSVRKAR